MEPGVHLAPLAGTINGVYPLILGINSVEVPVCAGSVSDTESRIRSPCSKVVSVSVKFEPLEEVHPVPAEGEFKSFWGVKPDQVSHRPFGWILKFRPT